MLVTDGATAGAAELFLCAKKEDFSLFFLVFHLVCDYFSLSLSFSTLFSLVLAPP